MADPDTVVVQNLYVWGQGVTLRAVHPTVDAEVLGEEERQAAPGDPRRRGEIARVQAAVADQLELVLLEEVTALHAARLELAAQLVPDRLIEARR